MELLEAQKAVNDPIDRLRNRQIMKYRPMILKVLNSWVRDVAKNPTLKTVKGLSDKDLKRVFELIYLEGSLPFARGTWRGIMSKSNHDIFPENDLLERLKKILRQLGSVRILGILVTTQEQLERIIRNGMETGLTITQISQEIQEVTNLNVYRATRIARTEVISASNIASFESATMTGKVKGKRWITAGDDRVRAAHSNVTPSGYIPMNDRFSVGGESMLHPHDPAASAKNTIHCRCRLVYTTV